MKNERCPAFTVTLCKHPSRPMVPSQRCVHAMPEEKQISARWVCPEPTKNPSSIPSEIVVSSPAVRRFPAEELMLAAPSLRSVWLSASPLDARSKADGLRAAQ